MPALPQSPPIGQLQAAASWQTVDLMSDLHLQVSEQATFEAWRHHMATTPAQAVLILGDLFEVWVGDDAVALDPFLQQCADVLRQTAQRCHVAFMPGNRDFLLGTDFLTGCGVQALVDPTVLNWGQQRILLSHGDALCLDDRDYQLFRQRVQSTPWQKEFLSKPLNERLALARAMRAQSEAQQQTGRPYADADSALSLQWLRAAQADRLVHGHTHRPADHPLGSATRQVLSDWSLDHAPVRAEVLRLHADGFSERVAVKPVASAP